MPVINTGNIDSVLSHIEISNFVDHGALPHDEYQSPESQQNDALNIKVGDTEVGFRIKDPSDIAQNAMQEQGLSEEQQQINLQKQEEFFDSVGPKLPRSLKEMMLEPCENKVEYKTVGGHTMKVETHGDSVHITNVTAMNLIRKHLATEHAKKVVGSKIQASAGDYKNFTEAVDSGDVSAAIEHYNKFTAVWDGKGASPRSDQDFQKACDQWKGRSSGGDLVQSREAQSRIPAIIPGQEVSLDRGDAKEHEGSPSMAM